MKETKKLAFTLTCLLILLSTLIIPPNTQANDHAASIDEFVKHCYDSERFTGSVLVAERGEVIYKKSFGLANREWNIPNQPDTKFRIASMSKQFTAMVIMQLFAEGRIALDETLADHLPEFRRDTAEQVTLHHLLTHTSGLPDYSDAPGFWNQLMRHPMTSEFVLDSLSSGDLDAEPGTEYRYNNGGYYILSLIAERVTGKNFGDVLQERIFGPLGMKDSGLDRPEMILPRRATGYEQNVDGTTNTRYRQIENLLGTGALYSTVEDLYLWDRALYTEKLLSEKYKNIMFTPHLNNYAYGWGVRKVQLGDTSDSTAYTGHSGSVAGFNSRIVRLVDDQHLIVLLCNLSEWTRLSAMSRGITSILYDLPYQLPRRSLARALYKVLVEEGFEAALDRYHIIRDQQPEAYDLDEDELNTLAYRLLRTDRVKESIEFFKLNAQAYPESWNAHDSLGEAYCVGGERELARESYDKSLQLNPRRPGTTLARMLDREDRE
ncbi:serine hydrolase [Candidatus Zixiibacteriota bacterium]